MKTDMSGALIHEFTRKLLSVKPSNFFGSLCWSVIRIGRIF